MLCFVQRDGIKNRAAATGLLACIQIVERSYRSLDGVSFLARNIAQRGLQARQQISETRTPFTKPMLTVVDQMM